MIRNGMGRMRLVYRVIINYFLTGFLYFIAITAFGQVQSSVFDNFTVSNGLSDNKIHCILQDSKGWIWVGSDYGIFRYDGYHFSKFTLNTIESRTLENSLIRTIYEDNTGNLWIGTDLNGVFKYDRNQYALKQYTGQEFVSHSVWAIKQYSQGKVWLGTDKGLILLNFEKNIIELTIRDKSSSGILTGSFIRTLFLNNDGKLWVGTDRGITILNKDNTLFRTYLDGPVEDELENQVWEIFRDNNGCIWAGTYLGGLKYLDSKRDLFVPYFLDGANNRSETVRAINQDQQGNLWVGTRGGLYSINLKSKLLTHYSNNIYDEHSLIHNSVLDLLVDKKGDLWIGTRSGVSFYNFDKQAFSYLSAVNLGEPQLNNNEVYELWEDDNGNLWIGTESGGLNIYNRKQNQIQYITKTNGLSNNCIKAIMPDNSGNMLIGTYLGGLNQYNPKSKRNRIFEHDPADPHSLSDNSVWTFLRDHQGRIWVGTSLGIDVFDEPRGVFERYGEKFNVGMVVMIFEDAMNRLWMYSSDLNKLTMVGTDNSVRDYQIAARAMCDDNKGNLWIASLGNGLVYLDPNTNKTLIYNTDSGLCNNVIYGLINIDNKYLWLSTSNGLSRFDIEKKEFKNFTNNNGLFNREFNYGAFIQCKDNTLVFGGKKGIDFIFPDKLHDNEYIPPVVLTDFRIFNKPVIISPDSGDVNLLHNFIYETRKIVLTHDQNMISFEFAALNYANSSKNMYKYKLEGFDKEWNDIGTSRLATYTNLDHGDYVFRVVGSNSDGKFNQKGTYIQLIVLPPFWKTWWFRAILILVVMGLFYLVYIFIINREKLKHQLFFERQAARQMQELDRLKHQFFMNISHEIRTPLSLIIGPLNKLIGSDFDRKNTMAHLHIIKRNTNILSRLVNQLLDYRKLETGNLQLELKKGNLRQFLEELVDSFKNMAEEKSVILEFNSMHSQVFTWFDADKMEKIVNNLLTNALKFTNPGGKVSVILSLTNLDELEASNHYIPAIDFDGLEDKQFIKIIVKDSGIGIPSSQVMKIFDRFRQINNAGKGGTGIGLSLTKELVTLHKGHIKVKSVEGKGSKFTLLFPFNEINYTEEVTSENIEGQTPDSNNNQVTEGKKQLNEPILLVIDDNSDIREFIKYHFEPEYQVIQAKDGKEGWDKTLEIIPDFIIADVMMPYIDGNELCRRIKKDERTSHIPVIILTALSSSQNQMTGIDAGADDYIVKPFDITLLKAKTDNMLAIRKTLRERYSKEMLLKPKDIVLTSPDEKFLKRVISIVEKNIAQPELDVDFLAKNVGVSRTQLYRKINALTDMAVKEFVKDIRLKRAAQLVAQDKLNISEIAYEVGFTDLSYFRKCFKEKFGTSASEYQKGQ